jgi:excisionase family DNA binding protein
MTTAAVEKWLTLDDVAGALRVSTQTAKRWVREGRIPQPIRVGRRLLFSAAEIHGHLESLRREGEDQNSPVDGRSRRQGGT